MILFSLFIETFWPVFAYNTVQIAKDAKLPRADREDSYQNAQCLCLFIDLAVQGLFCFNPW